MKIVIGTTSERKIQTAKKVCDEMLLEDVIMEGVNASSGVSETPRNEETYTGASNRAEFCKTINPEADIWLGVESGLAERYGSVYEEAWCVILSKEQERFVGYSSGLMIPRYVLQHMRDLGKEHFEVMEFLQNKHGTEKGDTWGNYSGKSISREVSLGEAIRNALIQMTAPESSYYKM